MRRIEPEDDKPKNSLQLDACTHLFRSAVRRLQRRGACRGARVVPDHRPIGQVVSATFEDANYCNSWMVKLCYAAKLLDYAHGCAADAGWLNSDDRLRPTVTTYGTSMALVLASGSTLLTLAPIVWHRIK